LKIGAVFGQYPDRAEISRLHDVRTSRAHRGHGFDGDDCIDQAAALPAVGLGERDAEEALLGHQAGDVPWIARCMRALARTGGEMLFRETQDRVAELPLLWRQLEVHTG
jgi:hypothetical protein